IAIGVLWYLRRRRAAAPEIAEEAPPAATVLPAALLPAKPRGKSDLPETADLNQMLTRLERALRERVPRRIDFRLSLLPDLWRCRADPDALRPVLLALVSGAVAELKSGGTLIVGTRNFTLDAALAGEIPGASAGEYARMTVRDNGSGFSEEALDRILDPAATARPSAAVA